MYGCLLCYKKIRRIESALRKFKDTKGIIGSRKSKKENGRQYNGQKENDVTSAVVDVHITYYVIVNKTHKSYQ
jgi:hypothetical protein